MKLSEEIALGRMLLRPVPGIVNDGEGGGCAFGMANAARGGSVPSNDWHKWVGRWQNFIALPCECRGKMVLVGGMMPVERQLCRTYRDGIVHVFNYHVCTMKDWTLDRLIEWIASIEPAEEEASVAAEPACQTAGREPRVLAAK